MHCETSDLQGYKQPILMMFCGCSWTEPLFVDSIFSCFLCVFLSFSGVHPPECLPEKHEVQPSETSSKFSLLFPYI